MDNLLTGTLLEWLGDHRQWVGLAIFLIALLESLAIAGLIIPGVVLLVAVTAMAGGGGMSFVAALAWAFCGAVLGDMLSFALGRFFHQDIRRIGLFRRHPQWISRAETFFQRYGLFSIFIGRFVGPIRPIIPMIAGMLDMPTLRFVAINLVSALAWAPVYVTPGFVAGRAIQWPVPAFFWQQTLTLLGLLAGLLLAVTLVLRAQHRWSNLLAALLCLVALAATTLAGARLDMLQQSVSLWLSEPPDGSIVRALEAMAPLAGPLFSLALLGLLVAVLAASKAWQALVLVGMATGICGLLALLIGASPQTSALAFSLLCIALIALLKNRPHPFWTRAAFMAGVAPAGLLLGAISLISLHTPPFSLAAAFLLAASGLLVALWGLERGGPVTNPSRPANQLLLWLPPLSAVVVSGLHYL